MIDKAYALAGVALASALAGFGGGWQVQGWRLGTGLARCEAARDDFEQQLQRQSQAVQAQAEAAQRAASAAAAQLAAARRATQANQAELDALQQRISAPKATTCGAAVAEIRGALEQAAASGGVR